MTECTQCTHAANEKFWGGYDLRCVGCCARLVASARPHRRLQEYMLESIARTKGAPSRLKILERLKESPHG